METGVGWGALSSVGVDTPSAAGQPATTLPRPHATTPSPAATPVPATTQPTPVHQEPLEYSPEELDWGSIEDEDGAFGLCQGVRDDEGQTAADYKGKVVEAAQVSLSHEGREEVLPDLSMSSVVAPLSTQPRLKSVVIEPGRHQSPISSAHDLHHPPAVRQNVSSNWQEVKPKFWWRRRGNPSSSVELKQRHGRPPAGVTAAPPRPAYKKIFWGKCFRCLASDHRLAQCRDPPRCFTCHCSGHFARHCPQNATKQRPVHQRLAFPATNIKQTIQSHLAFPSTSIHSLIAFPPLPSAVAKAEPAANQSPQQGNRRAMAYVAGSPHQRPARGQAAVVTGSVMSAELKSLRRRGIVITGLDHNYTPTVTEMGYALSHQLRIPRFNITVSRHKPEDFFARFDHPDQRDSAARVGRVEIGGTPFLLQRWQEDAYTRPHHWFYHCKIVIERLPLHAWSEEGVKQVLGDICLFDRMTTATFTQESTEMFSCWVWMIDPDCLPRSKTISFFPEHAGRTREVNGISPSDDMATPPPVGGLVDLLVHLDRYIDWTPQPSRLPGSQAGSSSRPFPFRQRFDWSPGVVDGRSPAYAAPRLAACRGLTPPDYRDQDPEDDQNGPPQRDRAYDSHARGWPQEDAPQGDCQRTRSPPPRGRRQHGDGVTPKDAKRGRRGSRPLTLLRRNREPQRRDDEGWERRRSRSPAVFRCFHKIDGDTTPKKPDAQPKKTLASADARHGVSKTAPSTCFEELEVAPEAPPPPTSHPDPLLDFLAGLCHESPLKDSSYSWQQQDPMLHESTGGMACFPVQVLTFSPPPSPPQADWRPRSPEYGPVSSSWAGGPRRGELTAQVDDIAIDTPEEAGTGFTGQMFVTRPPPILSPPAPAPSIASQQQATSSTSTTRRTSARQAARPSVVPVAKRATQRLIRQLDLVSKDAPIDNEAMKTYVDTYKKPLPRKAIAAIRAVTRLANGSVMAASAALAAEGETAEIEAA